MAVADDDTLVLRRAQQVFERRRRELADRRVEVPAVRGADRLDDLRAPRFFHGQPRPRRERSVAEAPVRVRDDERGVDLEPGPETRA
jgi:hypothetical protein